MKNVLVNQVKTSLSNQVAEHVASVHIEHPIEIPEISHIAARLKAML